MRRSRWPSARIAYDPRPLNDKIERTEDAPDWRRETITLDTAYGERLILYLYLPKSTAPPYQTVVYFPGGDAQLIRSSRELNLTNVDFVIRSGRALAFPVYKGTYERIVPLTGPNAGRDLTIARVKDFGRVVDYLVTRPDVDTARLGYYGASLGAFAGDSGQRDRPARQGRGLPGRRPAAGAEPGRKPTPSTSRRGFACRR